jgi:Protein of unknown function (DUF1569)
MESYLKRLQTELKTTIEGATDAAMQKAPEGKWNSDQILEHLYLSYKNTNKGIAKCLETCAPLATGATVKHHLIRSVVLGLGYLPGGFEAPKRVVPRGTALDEVRSRIFSEIESMDAGFTACEQHFGVATKILDNPRLGPLTAKQWRKFHLLHGKHHARQIRERIRL